ncbi:DMT family transporter [Aidingimonas halophila]|uniref:Permease of the drug/metabolite transporter (DMT) superfamily n=2 Tax=Aidingimonas halophila TaxID=574349 RepID=A0A1H2TY05_9GAMM|nr:DMT family transporter [Aidingimonas halophila]SDW48805.1 Permease of the drug/metabolite transporter (DMT) superfamily [Aidingimonas halophila]
MFPKIPATEAFRFIYGGYRMRSSHSVIGLLAGLLTVILWGSLPVLRNLVHLPPMLTAAIAMSSAAGFAQVLERWMHERKSPVPFRDWRFWVMGVGGLTGALYCYFLALGEGDPARVTLVTYTWPLGFVLVADRLAGRGLRMRTLLGALVAFSGLAPLILSSDEGISTSPLAYSAGLAAGMSWILFSLYLKDNSRSGLKNYKYIFACVAGTALLLHGLFEASVERATYVDWLMAASIGIGPYGLAFMTWGYALLRSPTTLLGILTYFVPVISSLFLVVVGLASPNLQLIVAVVAVLASAVITQTSLSMKWRELKVFHHVFNEPGVNMSRKYAVSTEHESSVSNVRDNFPALYMPAMPPLGFMDWSRQQLTRLLTKAKR